MPLVRVEVRNEYRLGMPELYKEANREDPKALLDGVAVAGLVGILRQLGDLADFAAEVFHGLQEEAMHTCSRSHKLMIRVQKIEAALPPLEKTILAQRSHLHFAYTTGSNWHAHLQSVQNHFIYGDLPRFIMDSYEECRSPPRLHLLDKFDTGGPGSCLKRYSDPTFFRRASAGFDEAYVEKVRRDKKAHRRKKKRMWLKNGEVPHGESHGMPVSSHSGRMLYASQNCDEQTSSQTVSTFDAALKSELGEKSHSFDSRAGSGYIECIFSPSYTMKSDGREPEEISSQFKLHGDTLDTYSLDEQRGINSQELIGSRSSCVTWDEKTEIKEPIGLHIDSDETTEMILTNFDLDPPGGEAVKLRTDYQKDFNFDNESMQASVSGGNQFDDIETVTDNYMDALNTIDLESETDLECQTKREVEQFYTLNNKPVDKGIHRLTPQHSDSHSLNFEPHVLDSEVHLECQTKPEVEQFSALNNKAVDEGMHRLTPQHSNSHSSNFEPNVPVHIPSNIAISKENYSSVSPESPKEANSLLNKEASITKPNSVPSECQSHVPSPQKVAESSTLNTFPDIDSNGSDDILDGSNAEIIVRNLSSSKSREPSLQTPKSDSILNSSCESQNIPSLPSSVTGINFWTNGGLLGLEPSKPPDFSVMNSVDHDSVAKFKEETDFCSDQSNFLEGDGNAAKTNIVKNSKMAKLDISSQCSTSCHNDQEDSISMMSTSWRSSQVHLNVKLEDSTDFHHSISSNQSHKLGFCESSSKIPGTEEPVNPDAQATKSCKYDGKNSSPMFEFTNRLLVNGFQRKVSHVGDDNFVSCVKNGVSEQKNMSQEYQAFSGRTFKEQFGSRSSFMSPSSSPPLEHMKISFQPIDIFETSKLKLKFPDASECRESGGDMFPSFQLVPEQSISLQDLGSDSDDDTFCKSSPNRSDDCLGHHSQSDSEQWEAGESPRCKDHEIYDALCRISTTDSVSSDLEIGRNAQGVIVDNYELQNPFTENCMQPSQCRVLDLPSFDTLNPSFGQELHNDFDAKYHQESDFSKEPTSPSPPLPPVEWQAMKPNPDVAIEKQDTSFEALKHAIDLKLSPSTTSQQPKPAPVKHEQNTEALICTTRSKPDGQKLNGQKDAKQPSNGKEMDEKEDFLQQIKTKSFSLRRTVSDRPASTPGAPANVKVTAILEKANAIRQDVGGDDDSWSDT